MSLTNQKVLPGILRALQSGDINAARYIMASFADEARDEIRALLEPAVESPQPGSNPIAGEFPEINPANYDDEDVRALNAWGIRAHDEIERLRAALIGLLGHSWTAHDLSIEIHKYIRSGAVEPTAEPFEVGSAQAYRPFDHWEWRECTVLARRQSPAHWLYDVQFKNDGLKSQGIHEDWFRRTLKSTPEPFPEDKGNARTGFDLKR